MEIRITGNKKRRKHNGVKRMGKTLILKHMDKLTSKIFRTMRGHPVLRDKFKKIARRISFKTMYWKNKVNRKRCLVRDALP